MAERRNSFLDLIALGVLLLGLIVAACVFSHDPTQLSPINAYPPAESQSNLLGEPGNWLAVQLFQALGNAVYFVMACWFVLVLYLFVGQRSNVWALRLFGWFLLIPCVAVIADFAGTPGISFARGGGSVGAWLGLWLEESFSLPGRLLLFGSCLALSVLLALDFVVIAFCARTWKIFRAVTLVFFRMVLRRNQQATPTIARAGKKPAKDQPTVDDEPSLDEILSGDVEDIPIQRAAEKLPEKEAATDEQEATRTVPIHRPAPVPQQETYSDYELPAISLLDDAEPFPYEEHDQHLREQAKLLEKTFKDFALNVRVVGINTGPVITQYEIALETGLRVHKVTRLADDIALNLKVVSVRMVAPIPGKNTVGVEIPNEHRAIVRLKEVMLTAGKPTGKMTIPVYLGKDTEGRAMVYDLADMPHLLIAGRTGTGKSVCLNGIILSMLMTRRPDEVKMLMIDPKRTELSEYGQLPHLMHPVVTDMKKAEAILSWAVDEMERRYDLLSQARVRNLASFNQLPRKEKLKRIKPAEEDEEHIPDRLPSIVIIVDEMADLMMTMKREVEGHIIRLAQKSRAAGIHLVVATQKPTVDVITGLIKSNLPARICFQVSSRSDSRVVLDEMGADKLLGKGDMLFLQPGTSTLLRAQATYASDDEITRVVEALEGEPEFAEELLNLGNPIAEGSGNFHERLRSRDEVYEQAIEIVVREGRGSVSLLQRALGIGYGRAARLIDFMAEDSIVGPYRGSNARDVLVTPEEWDQMKQSGEMVQGV